MTSFQVESLRRQQLTAADDEQLPCERGGALARLPNLFRLFPPWVLGNFSGGSRRRPMITASTLLKSCAIPPARRPIASTSALGADSDSTDRAPRDLAYWSETSVGSPARGAGRSSWTTVASSRTQTTPSLRPNGTRRCASPRACSHWLPASTSSRSSGCSNGVPVLVPVEPCRGGMAERPLDLRTDVDHRAALDKVERVGRRPVRPASGTSPPPRASAPQPACAR